jgi:hypothetical protein
VNPQAVGASTGGLVDAADEGVVSAFVLGWHMAELFHSRVPGSVRRRQVSLDKLAGIGELDPLSQARLLLAQVRVDLQRVWRFIDLDHQQPDTGPVRSLLEADARAPGEFQAAMASLHGELLVALTAADFRLGKAYGLGRALAETALVPDARNPQTFQRLFARYRLANLLEWLADLKSVFPPHAARRSVGHCHCGRPGAKPRSCGRRSTIGSPPIGRRRIPPPRPCRRRRPAGPSPGGCVACVRSCRRVARSTGTRRRTARA